MQSASVFPDSQFSRYFRKAKFSEPTPVQIRSWPHLLEHRNLLAIAPTGSGKTLAFLLPLASIIAKEESCRHACPAGLILTPTRELALQIQSHARRLLRVFGVQSVCIYGGSSQEEQLKALATGKKFLVVATPGRLLDFLRTGKILLQKVRVAILDEADRMLSMGFREQLQEIANELPGDRRGALFSATFPESVRTAAQLWFCSKDFKVVDVSMKRITPEKPGEQPNVERSAATDVEQVVHVCAEHKKPKKLLKYLQNVFKENSSGLRVRLRPMVLIFCNRIKTVKFVADFLGRHEFTAGILHGEMPQMARERVLANFRANKLTLLVATDVVSRGMDIKKLGNVVNYDMPPTMEQYIHRIGRTGRMGAEGFAYTFFTRHFLKLAPALVEYLESCEQKVDPNLIKLLPRDNEDDAPTVESAVPAADLEDADVGEVYAPRQFGSFLNLAQLPAIPHITQSSSSSSDDGDESEHEVQKSVAEKKRTALNGMEKIVDDRSSSQSGPGLGSLDAKVKHKRKRKRGKRGGKKHKKVKKNTNTSSKDVGRRRRSRGK